MSEHAPRVVHEPHCNVTCNPGEHHLTSGVLVHLHRTDIKTECGECNRMRNDCLPFCTPCGCYHEEGCPLADTEPCEEFGRHRVGGHSDAVKAAAERVRVGFRYRDGEILSPEREAKSADEEVPVVVLDLGDGEWMTLDDLRAVRESRDEEHA